MIKNAKNPLVSMSKIIQTRTGLLSKATEMINTCNPIESIETQIRRLKTPSVEDIMNIRRTELSKYKTNLFLYRELQHEINSINDSNLISVKINKDILSQKWNYSEDDSDNLFLHKKTDDHFVLVHFKYIRPVLDKKKSVIESNKIIEYASKQMTINTGIFSKLTGMDNNSLLKEQKKKEMWEQGEQYVEEEYPDKFPKHFNVNIINKRSEVMQYVCSSEEHEVSIHSIRLYPHATELEFLGDVQENLNEWKNRVIKKKKKKLMLPMNDIYSPEFYTLNPKLQRELINFLTSIEITPDIANYVKYLGLNKEKREYTSWLFKLIKFLS